MNHKHKKYKNLAFFVLSLLVAYFLSSYEPFHIFLLGLGKFGYLSAFIAGMLYVSMFTVATGAVMLLVLAEQYSLVELAVIAACGSVITDFLIFKYVKNSVTEEVVGLHKVLGGSHFSHVLHSKYFSWTLPVIGALIIASPLPDEVGISLMGLTKLDTKKFLVIAFIMDALGVALIVSASKFIKP